MNTSSNNARVPIAHECYQLVKVRNVALFLQVHSGICPYRMLQKRSGSAELIIGRWRITQFFYLEMVVRIIKIEYIFSMVKNSIAS